MFNVTSHDLPDEQLHLQYALVHIILRKSSRLISVFSISPPVILLPFRGFTREYTERSLNNCTNILASGSLDVVLSHTLIISELGLNAATGVLLFMQSESRSTRRQSLLEASESANFESEKKNSLRSGLESHGWTLDGLDSDTPNLVHIERFQVAPSVTTPSTRKPLFSNKIIASSTIFVSSSSEAAPLQSLEGLHLVVDPLLLHMLQLSHLQRH
ncbi:Replication protein A 70 kDa DNA-binding subunit A [Frankliniella fusca]|uniref:Replication protein A 70 kDa DNA-binding subunit A n=1 Tax=Frankliniella fusca TaxID=407009 RepID=A0AAE1HFE2_9NEOP|nr:Replication protein A 70 kDa DNA-binding subunit A [Frankliniella fusca]